MKLYLSLGLTLLIGGCANTSYVCPLDGQPGGCSSQSSAYQKSLDSNGEGLSVFDEKKISKTASQSSGDNLVYRPTIYADAEQGDFIYQPPQVERTWFASYHDPQTNHIVGSHSDYWVLSEGQWNTPVHDVAGSASTFLKPGE